MPEAERKVDEELQLVRVAKDLFLSRWYTESVRGLFDDERQVTLDRIAEESAEERRAAFKLIERWRAEHPAVGRAAREIAKTTRRDFLAALADAKRASGDVFDRAADAAPASVTEGFRELAQLDYRHAEALEALLDRE